MIRILLVEDDQTLLSEIQKFLAGEGIKVEVAHDAETALTMLKLAKFSVLVLDWNLPKKSGLDICIEVRRRDDSTPILFLTGNAAIEDKERGFLTGADDYLTKPFDAKELLWRIKALSKREGKDTVLEARDICLDTKRKEIRRQGALLHMSPKELEILEFLMRHPGRYFSTRDLLNRLWEVDSETTEQNVRTYMMKIRKVLEIPGDPPYIGSRYGFGYCFLEG